MDQSASAKRRPAKPRSKAVPHRVRLDLVHSNTEAPPSRPIDLAKRPPSPSLLHDEDLSTYVAERFVPWRRRGPRRVVYVSCDPERTRRHLVTYGETDPDIRPVSSAAFDACLAVEFEETLGWRARELLWRTAPQNSARVRVTVPVASTLTFLGCFAVFGASTFPLATMHIAAGLASFAFLALALLRLYAIPRSRSLTGPNMDSVAEPLHEPYTVLVALYREAEMVEALIASLLALDYPVELLDIKFILEADDLETAGALDRLPMPEHFSILKVPPCEPRTKPKALNFALPLARGTYLTVYDAEDRPHPNQLCEAARAFRNGGRKLAYLQAPLNYYNWNENWLTRQFSLEYAGFFGILLKALGRAGLPMPLGGTSNHCRTAALRAVGGWDPYNVTEDADLGFRFAAAGYHSGFIEPGTQEEASLTWRQWLPQRTRWLKGWMQTALVRLRSPARFVAATGISGSFAGFAMLSGFLAAALAFPWTATALAWSILHLARSEAFGLGHIVLGPHLAALMFGYAVAFATTAVAALDLKRPGMLVMLASLPLYWAMISVAAYRALFQLIWAPWLWEKTDHGLTTYAAPALTEIATERRYLAAA